MRTVGINIGEVIILENYIESKYREGKTYVDQSFADNGCEQEHIRNIGKKLWEIQWREFLNGRGGNDTVTEQNNSET